MPTGKRLVFAAVVLALAGAIAAAAWWPRLWNHNPVSIGEALVGGPFAMTDQNGRRVTEQDFRGKFMLVFFGYTYCPDVCPTELQVMAAAAMQLGAGADRLRLVFVSIDPERDTPAVVKSYVENFGAPITGLTGSAVDVATMAKAYRVFYRKAPAENGKDYAMDHSSIIYLMGPDGKFVKHFTYSTDAKALAEGLAAAMAGSSEG